jgi:glycosyltransferase involved in cell wall biosynthesis
MAWALIVATYGRSMEVRRLLESLVDQQGQSLRVILVDQNQDGRLEPIVQDYRDRLRIDHIRTLPRGVSQARNVGLSVLRDESLVAFPDDDCCYEQATLPNATSHFEANPAIAAIIGAWYPIGETYPPKPVPTRVRYVGRFQAIGVSSTITLFFRRSAIDAINGFDETLGPGAGTPWSSSEDTDYFLRAAGLKGAVTLTNDVRVFHPRVDGSTPGFETKAYGYGRGRMRILRKHNYPLWFQLANILHPLLAAMLSPPAVRRFRWHLFRGRLHEWLKPYQQPNIK